MSTLNMLWSRYAVMVLVMAVWLPSTGADDNASGKPNQDTPGFWGKLSDFFLPHLDKRRILYEKQTRYFMVTVEQDYLDRRHLVFNPNKGSQGIWDPADPDELVSNYCRYSASLLPLAAAAPRRVLFIGMGAGLLPRFVRSYARDAVIDIVEIDDEIPGIARDYFDFKTDAQTNIIIEDGRAFINRTANHYDFIFIDAYNAECIPFHLTTVEFYRKVRSALSPGGMMSVNVANAGKPGFVAAELKTIAAVFPDPAVLACSGGHNYIVLAPAPTVLPQQNASSSRLIPLNELWDDRLAAEKVSEMTDGAAVLTDDFAPVETLK